MRTASSPDRRPDAKASQAPRPPAASRRRRSSAAPGKGNTASKLRYIGRTLRDNRHGLIANARARRADGDAEREAAKAIIADAGQAAAPEAVPPLGASGQGL